MNRGADSNAEESTDAGAADGTDEDGTDAGAADGTDAGAADGAGGSAGPYDHLRTTELAPLVEEYGELDLSTEGELFERLVVSVVRQRISTVQADRIVADLRDRHEITPAAMLAVDEAGLRAVGLSGQKVEYVRNAARWWREHDPSPEAFVGMDDDAVVDSLTEITGVGEWTAEMVLMLGLERPDVFPVGDLAVRREVERLVAESGGVEDEDAGSGDAGSGDAGEAELTRREIREVAEAWRPYRSYATMYLWWRYVDENLDVDPEGLTL